MVCREFSSINLLAQRLLKRLPHISLSLLGKTILPVSLAKDLGVYVHQDLTYDVPILKQPLVA